MRWRAARICGLPDRSGWNVMRLRLELACWVIPLLPVIAPPAALAGPAARLEAASRVLAPGETARFSIEAGRDRSSELRGWCELSASGAASLGFDGEHYVPLSEPAVGDVITLSAGETRRYEITGTVERNAGDAYIAFTFTGVPAAMCFPGMQCEGAGKGASSVSVSCGPA